MTDAQLDAKARRQDQAIARWARSCVAPISSAVDAARDHAVAALTETLKTTPDGRATARKVRSSRSFASALARPDELLTKLAGPSIDATSEGLIRDARESFYRDAFAEWVKLLPAEVARPNASPTAAGIASARRLVLHGYELRAEIQGPTSKAGESLGAVLTLAGKRSTDGRVQTDLIGQWAARTKAAIGQAVKLAASDSAIALDRMAGRDVCRPELLDEDPYGDG